MLLLGIASLTAQAQIQNVIDTTSTPAPGSGNNYIHLLNATVNPANGSLSIRINIPLPKGRGLNLPFAIAYDSNSLFQITNNRDGYGPAILYDASEDAYSKSGWSYTVPRMTLTKVQVSNGYPVQGTHYWSCDWNTDYVFFDPEGGDHALHLGLEQSYDSEDPNGSPECPTFIDEGTGDHLYASSAGNRTVGPTVRNADNTLYNFPPDGLPAFNGVTSNGPPVYDTLLPTTVEDRNGNIITISKSGSGFTYTDTLGRNELSVSSFGGASDSISVSGFSQPYVAVWTNETASGFSLGFTPVSGSDSQCASSTETSGSSLAENVISTLTMPNGQKYTFSYDPVYGLLDQITYPGGGWVKYDWGVLPQYEQGTYYWEQPPPPPGYPTPPPVSDPISPAPLSYFCKETYDWVGVTHRYVSFDGTNVALRQDFTYSYSASTGTKTTTVVTTDLTTGKSHTTVYTYSMITDEMNDPYVPANFGPESQFVTLSPQEKTITYEDASNTVLKTVNKTWSDPYLLESEATTLGSSGPTSKTVYSYGGFTDITEKDYYAFGASSPTRKTIINYATFGSTPIFDRPSSVTVENGNGTTVAETDYAYDQTAVAPVTATSHDETNYGSSSATPRGNATTVTRECLSGCTNATTTYTYDETGQVLSATTACGNTSCGDMSSGTSHTTHYSYTDNYATGTPPENTDAYVTQITDPLGHTQSFSYNYATGELATAKDANGNTTSYSYADPMNRLTQTDYPGGGETTIAYNDSARTVTTSELLNTSNQWETHVSVMDGVGHVVQTQLTTDPGGTDYVSTTYNGMGEVASVTNPYRGTSDPTYGVTSYQYDALGRKTIQTLPDGSTEQWCYDDMASTGQTNCLPNKSSQNEASWVDYSDETGRHWQRAYDALGSLIAVMEPNSSNIPALETDYQYDVLGNLTEVDQWGGTSGSSGDRKRTFTYDSLGQLLTATNPETGTVSYAYDANGNVSNKVDARGADVYYCYDGDNRVVSKAYTAQSCPMTSPVATYAYDSSSISGASNDVGRLTSAVAYNGNTVVAETLPYAYSPMGRLKNEEECTPANCSGTFYSLGYTYDLNGDVTSATNGAPNDGVSLGYLYNDAAQLSQVTATTTWNDNNHPSKLFGNAVYGPAGLVSADLSFINTSGQPAISVARSYDSRMQITGETVTGDKITPAVAGSATLTINGASDQSRNNQATQSQTEVYIEGQEQTSYGQPDSGYVYLAVDGFNASASYGSSSTSSSVAASLASQLNSSGVVTATANGNVVSMISVATGTAANYAWSVTTYSRDNLNPASFYASPSSGTMTGGTNAGTTYDSGTVSLTLDGAEETVNYGQGDTNSTVASKLASAFSSNSAVAVTSSGSSLDVTAKTAGANTNYDYSFSETYDSANFSQPSFTSSPSSGSLSGGANESNNPSTVYSYSIAPYNSSNPSASGYAANGDILQFDDLVMGDWSYQYDNLNRVVSGLENSGGPTPDWSDCFSYDAWGNRTSEAYSATGCGNSPAPTVQAQYNTANRITETDLMPTGDVYDAAGDVTDDGVDQYVYDNEGRICAVHNLSTGTMTGYVYNAAGDRVAKGGLTSFSCDMATNGFSLTASYALGQDGQVVSAFDGSNNWQYSNVYAGDKLLGVYTNSPSELDFVFTNWLGTTRVTLHPDGSTATHWCSLAYGNDLTQCGGNGADPDNLHFTGKERDQESGLDYFGARYYASTMGRFLRPDYDDSYDPPEAAPYTVLGDPQTLNLYGYVGNNPLSNTDPDGHDCRTDTYTAEYGGKVIQTETFTDLSTCPDFDGFIVFAPARGHHFIPKATWTSLEEDSDAWRFLDKVVSGKLKQPRLSNPYDKLHRALNEDVQNLLEREEFELGRSAQYFTRGDWEQFRETLQTESEAFQAFNERLAALEPEAKSFGEAFAEALEEVYPAARQTIGTTIDSVGPIAEGAAESGLE